MYRPIFESSFSISLGHNTAGIISGLLNNVSLFWDPSKLSNIDFNAPYEKGLLLNKVILDSKEFDLSIEDAFAKVEDPYSTIIAPFPAVISVAPASDSSAAKAKFVAPFSM